MQTTHVSSNLLHTDALTTLVEASHPLIVRAAENPLRPGATGETSAFLLTGAQTGGRVTLASMEVDVNGGPPPHVHQNDEEIFVVQSGAFELLVNGELVEARAGDVAYGSRGEAHRLRRLDSGEENHFYIIIAPSSFEHFMARWIPLFENGMPSMEQAVALCGEYGIDLYPSDDLTPPVPDQPQSKVIANGQGTVLDVAGTKVTVLLSAADTQGRYALMRVEGPRDAGPPPHIHTREDELFLVEEGQVEFVLGDEVVMADKGDVVWVPRDHAHTFRLASDYARMTIFKTPGGFEGFYVEAAEMERAGGVELNAMLDLGARYGMKFPAFM